MARPYTLTPLKVGCEVVGINLSEAVNKNTIKLIKEDVREHQVLVFRNQSGLSPGRHVEIGKWFGEIESTFYKHPKSPHSTSSEYPTTATRGVPMWAELVGILMGVFRMLHSRTRCTTSSLCPARATPPSSPSRISSTTSRRREGSSGRGSGWSQTSGKDQFIRLYTNTLRRGSLCCVSTWV